MHTYRLMEDEECYEVVFVIDPYNYKSIKRFDSEHLAAAYANYLNGGDGCYNKEVFGYR